MVKTDIEFRDLAHRVANACLSRRGFRQQNRIRFCCPVHKDSNPSADYVEEFGTWTCRSCYAGGGLLTGDHPIARILGLDDPKHVPQPVPDAPTAAVATEETERRRAKIAPWHSDARGVAELFADEEAYGDILSRGIGDVAIRSFGLGLVEYPFEGAKYKAISIPWVENCVTVGLQYRFLSDSFPDRYRWAIGSRSALFNSWAYECPTEDTVLVVEGALKAATIWSLGFASVVAIANKKSWRPEFWEKLAPFGRVVFALDPDAEAEAIIAAEGIPSGQSYVARFPEKIDDFALRCDGDPECIEAIIDCARRIK